jgi:hypothetical protein
MILKGWIIADESEREFLESLGLKLGPYDPAAGEFTACTADDEAMDRLNPHWGRFYWGLFPMEDPL